jgi:hypothetical protein
MATFVFLFLHQSLHTGKKLTAAFCPITSLMNTIFITAKAGSAGFAAPQQYSFALSEKIKLRNKMFRREVAISKLLNSEQNDEWRLFFPFPKRKE